MDREQAIEYFDNIVGGNKWKEAWPILRAALSPPAGEQITRIEPTATDKMYAEMAAVSPPSPTSQPDESFFDKLASGKLAVEKAGFWKGAVEIARAAARSYLGPPRVTSGPDPDADWLKEQLSNCAGNEAALTEIIQSAITAATAELTADYRAASEVVDELQAKVERLERELSEQKRGFTEAMEENSRLLLLLNEQNRRTFTAESQLAEQAAEIAQLKAALAAKEKST